MSRKDESLKLNTDIVLLACRGFTAKRIAATLGVKQDIVRHRLYRLRAAGCCPPVALCREGRPNASEWVAKLISERSKPTRMRSTSPNAGRMWRLPVVPGTEKPVMLGTMNTLVRSLGKDVTCHIAQTMPPGVAMAEYIAGIVKDAVLEEIE
jgi:hypothetical protein